MALGGWLGTLVDPGGLPQHARQDHERVRAVRRSCLGRLRVARAKHLACGAGTDAGRVPRVAAALARRGLGKRRHDDHHRGRHRQRPRRFGAAARWRVLRPGCGLCDPALVGDLADLDAFAAAPSRSQRVRGALALRGRNRSLPAQRRARRRSSLESARARSSSTDSRGNRGGASLGARRARAACRRNPHRQQFAGVARPGGSAVSTARHAQGSQ